VACPSSIQRQSTLPIIGQAFRAETRVVKSVQPAKTMNAPPQRDFHCVACGVTKQSQPNYRHKCPGDGPVAYQIERSIICGQCTHNRDGVCMPLKTKHKELPCVVEIGVKLPGVECPLKKWRRVLFNCEKCGSSRFDENGLTECPNCNPRSKPRTALIAAVRDKPAAPNRDIAIISVATGQKATDLAKITFPRFARYADFVGADFLEVRTNHYPRYPLANKFRIGTITANYRRVLYLDADIWLRSGVGNLFEILSPGSVWMHPDVERFSGSEWSITQSAIMGKEQSITPSKSRVYNSGVVMFDQSHSNIWSPPPKPMSTSHVAEQFWVEHQALSTATVSDLHWQFNCQWYWPDFAKLEPHAKIIHLANCPQPERITRLKQYEAIDADFA
jgi:hypothetical protein